MFKMNHFMNEPNSHAKSSYNNESPARYNKPSENKTKQINHNLKVPSEKERQKHYYTLHMGFDDDRVNEYILNTKLLFFTQIRVWERG